MHLRAGVREVVVARTVRVVRQPAATSVDVDQLAREAARVVGVVGVRVEDVVRRRLASAQPEGAVRRRAHRPDRVRGRVGRDAVARVRHSLARRVAVAADDHALLPPHAVVRPDGDAREARCLAAVLTAAIDLVRVEQVDVAGAGEVTRHGHAQQPSVAVGVHVVGDVEHGRGGGCAGRGDHLQDARLLDHEHAAVGRPVDCRRRVEPRCQDELLEAGGQRRRTRRRGGCDRGGGKCGRRRDERYTSGQGASSRTTRSRRSTRPRWTRPRCRCPRPCPSHRRP